MIGHSLRTAYTVRNICNVTPPPPSHWPMSNVWIACRLPFGPCIASIKLRILYSQMYLLANGVPHRPSADLFISLYLKWILWVIDFAIQLKCCVHSISLANPPTRSLSLSSCLHRYRRRNCSQIQIKLQHQTERNENKIISILIENVVLFTNLLSAFSFCSRPAHEHRSVRKLLFYYWCDLYERHIRKFNARIFFYRMRRTTPQRIHRTCFQIMNNWLLSAKFCCITIAKRKRISEYMRFYLWMGDSHSAHTHTHTHTHGANSEHVEHIVIRSWRM